MENLILPPPVNNGISFDFTAKRHRRGTGIPFLLLACLLLFAAWLPIHADARNTCGGWIEAAIGSPLSGTAQFDACTPGTITITSAGLGSSTADKQYMMQRELCGNGEIVVTVESISNGRAGVEIRADNTAGAIKRGLKTSLAPSLFQYTRSTPDAAPSQNLPVALNHRRLRLVRNGNQISLYWSSIGTNWTFAGAQTLNLPSCARIGIFVESNNASLATGIFSNLSVSGFTLPDNPLVTTFSFAAGSLSADAGQSVQVCVNAANPCACAPASVQVALQGNAAPHLSGFSTQTLQFQGNETQKCFDLPTVAAPGDGAYTLVLQNPTGGNAAAIGAQASISVAVTGEPETPTGCPWAGPDREICRGESVVIGCAEETPPTGTYYCYKWTPEAGLDDPSLAQPTASPQQTTTYTVYVTDNKGNLVATEGVLVTVKGSEISIIADKEVLCPGETALLSTEEGLTSYSWSIDGAPVNETTHSITVNVAGKYEVEAIDLEGCEVRAEIIIASSNAQSGLREKFISEGFICIPITILDDDPGILPPAPNTKSLLTMDLVDDFANKNILIDGASEYPVNVAEVIERVLTENFLSDYATSQLKGYVSENASFCGDDPDAVTYEQIRADFQSKEIGFWFHLWKNPDVEGEDCLLVKAKTPRVPAPGFSPVSEEHSAYIFEIIDLIKQDNPQPGDFSSQGERIVYALCEMLWEGFEIEIAENPDELIDVLELKIKEQAPPGTMGISQFINLVKAEEAKYPESEQRNTKLMITRLRRIFYNSGGFNNYLIPNAPSVNVVPSPYGDHFESERGRLTVTGKWFSFDLVDIENYPFDYTINDKPTIYKNQEVRLEAGVHAGLHIDMGHVFCGLDAFNYQSTVHVPILTSQVVFLPNNISASTWIGDLGSSLAYARASFVNNHFLPSELQAAIDIGTPAKDMLGNIDGYVIAYSYLAPLSITANGSAGPKVSEILENYYLGVPNYYTFNGLNLFQNKRYSIFAARIGLQWQPTTQAFLNEPAKVIDYGNQVGTSGFLFVGVSAPGFQKIAAAIFGTELKFIPFRKELARLLFKSLKQAIIDQE